MPKSAQLGLRLLLTLLLGGWQVGAAANTWSDVLAAAVGSELSLGAPEVKVILLGNLLRPQLAERYQIDLQIELQRPQQADVLWLSAEQARELYLDDRLFGPVAAALPNSAQVDSELNPATITHAGQYLHGYPVAVGWHQLRYSAAENDLQPADMEQLLGYMLGSNSGYYLPAEAHPALLGQVIYRVLDYHQANAAPPEQLSPELTYAFSSYARALKSANFAAASARDAEQTGLRLYFYEQFNADTRPQYHYLQHPSVAEAVFVGVNSDSDAKAAAQVLINEILEPPVQRFMVENGFFSGSVLVDSQSDLQQSPAYPLPHPDWLTLLEQQLLP